MRRIRAGAVAAAAVAALAGAAPPASAAVGDLRVRLSCTLGLSSALVSFTQDGTAVALRGPDAEVPDVPVPREPGPVLLGVRTFAGGAPFRLLDADGRVLASAPSGYAPCGGWSHRDDFVHSPSAAPDSPLFLGDVPSVPDERTPEGVAVYRTPLGALYERSVHPYVFVVRGAIHGYHLQHGEFRGFLGYPTTSESGVQTLDGSYTGFEGGTVYWGPRTGGAHAVRGELQRAYAARGYEHGGLGLPLTDEIGPLRDGGYGQHFQHGSLYWSPLSGAGAVKGAILQRWASLHWERSVLGYPVGDEQRRGVLGQGRLQVFNGGSVLWHPATGAHVLRGAVRDRYAAAGAELGALGYPLTGEFGPLRDGGAGQHFQGGSIYWSRVGGARVVPAGPVRDTWARGGWERGALGYPVSEQVCTGPGRCWQEFDTGRLHSAGAGALTVRGAIGEAYLRAGGEVSALGWPTSEERPEDGLVRQDFEGGSITWSPARGAVVVPAP